MTRQRRTKPSSPPAGSGDDAERYRAVFDETAQGIVLLDRAGRVLDANREALQFRRLRLVEVRGRLFWRTAWWDISYAVQRRLRAAVRKAARGAVVGYRVNLLDHEGAVASIDLALHPVGGRRGRSEFIVAESRNITERVRVEQALRRARDELALRVSHATAELAASNTELTHHIAQRQKMEVSLRESAARMEAILRTAADGIIVINYAGIIESANPAARKLFGYSSEELMGRNVKMLMPPPYRAAHDHYLRRYLQTGKARIIGIGREVVGLRKDGATFPMDLAVSETQLADGRRIFTGIVRDITERRRLEREILQISADEQRRIGQDLHDGLCQHLAGIAFASEVLKKKLVAKDVPEHRAVVEIGDMVDEAITLARGLARGLHPVQVEGEGLVSALRELAASIAEVFGIYCGVQCRTSFLIDDNEVATHLYRIAQEAISNAIKHGNARHVTIVLAADDERVKLSVRDDGAGLGNRTGKSKGMGLSIMNYRARIIGGTFEVTRGERGGTVVTCSLPRQAAGIGDSHGEAQGR